MPLHPPDRYSRERILSFGGSGLGKSHDFYTIAQLAQKTNSPAQFFIADTDESVGRMRRGFPDLGNLRPKMVHDWETLIAAMKEFYGQMTEDDWVMIDMISPSWQWVQDYFTHRVFKKDLGNYFLEMREKMKPTDKKAQNFEGWKDWPVINGLYAEFATMLLRCPGNLYCTAEVKGINSDTVEKDTKLMFGPYGVVPVGQKRTPHQFQTVLWKTAVRPDEWEIITIKDRARPKLEGAKVNNFALDYLVRVGGWQLGAEQSPVAV